jgi:hypothetical protein
MISKILVPLDGSKFYQAAKYAVYLAKQTRASLSLLSIIKSASWAAKRFHLPHVQPIRVSQLRIT